MTKIKKLGNGAYKINGDYYHKWTVVFICAAMTFISGIILGYLWFK